MSTPEGIAPSRPQRPKPALRAELLFYLTFLAAFALLVGVATSLLALAMAPERGVAAIVILIALEVASSCCTVARS